MSAFPILPRAGAEKPEDCPFCRSQRIINTGGKVINETTYWRCEACGQIWHPSRLKASAYR